MSSEPEVVMQVEITEEHRKNSYLLDERFNTQEMGLLSARFLVGNAVAGLTSLSLMHKMGGVEISKLSFLKSGAFWAGNVVGSTVALVAFITTGAGVFYRFLKPRKEQAQKDEELENIEWEKLSEEDRDALGGFYVPDNKTTAIMFAKFLPAGVVTFSIFNAVLPLTEIALKQIAPESVMAGIARDATVAVGAMGIFYGATKWMGMTLPNFLMPGGIAGLMPTSAGLAAAEAIISAAGIDGFWAQTAVRAITPAVASAAGVAVGTFLDYAGSWMTKAANLRWIEEGKKPVQRFVSHFWSRRAECEYTAQDPERMPLTRAIN